MDKQSENLKVCKIINNRSSYYLDVDGIKIPFGKHRNAEPFAKYFEEHYKKLGYVVKRMYCKYLIKGDEFEEGVEFEEVEVEFQEPVKTEKYSEK